MCLSLHFFSMFINTDFLSLISPFFPYFFLLFMCSFVQQSIFYFFHINLEQINWNFWEIPTAQFQTVTIKIKTVENYSCNEWDPVIFNSKTRTIAFLFWVKYSRICTQCIDGHRLWSNMKMRWQLQLVTSQCIKCFTFFLFNNSVIFSAWRACHKSLLSVFPLTSVLSPVYDLLLCIQCVGRVSPGVSQWGGNLLNKLLIVSLFCFIISRVISYAADVGHVCREKCTITILTANSTVCFGICQNKLNICLLNKEKMGKKTSLIIFIFVGVIWIY